MLYLSSFCMYQGAKNQKNVLQGALRRLEMANITVVNVPKDPEDNKDPNDSETEDEPPTLLPLEVTPPSELTQNVPGRNLADDNSYSQTESNADMYEDLGRRRRLFSSVYKAAWR
jgi:hypothetical protein